MAKKKCLVVSVSGTERPGPDGNKLNLGQAVEKAVTNFVAEQNSTLVDYVVSGVNLISGGFGQAFVVVSHEPKPTPTEKKGGRNK